MQLFVDANDCLQHQVAFELVKLVVLHLKLARVTFDAKEPRPSSPVYLKSELKQLAEATQRHIFVFAMSRLGLCLH